jgi:hypothetical protein
MTSRSGVVCPPLAHLAHLRLSEGVGALVDLLLPDDEVLELLHDPEARSSGTIM